MKRHCLVVSGLLLAACGLTPSAGSGPTGHTDIFVVNADGSGRLNLTSGYVLDDDHPALSPDGRTLVFERVREGGNGWTNLVTMPSHGGAPRVLVTLPEESAAGPSWSRDGRLIAFTGCTQECTRVGVVRRDGTGLTWIADASDPAWLPHRRIAFISYDFEGRRSIAVARADGTHRREIVHPSDLVDASRLWPPEPSPTGTAIAFSASSLVDNHRALYVASVDGGYQPRQVSASGSHPAWSPDGVRVAFYRASTLWTVRADGSRQRRLSPPSIAAVRDFPVWSSDDRSIAFISKGRARATCRVVVLNLQRRTFTRVTRSAEPGYGICGGRRPLWSRDSRRIYYVALGG